jgi:hypothetical protein
MQNIELEQTFKQLAAQFVEKQADLQALETKRHASAQRLEDELKKETELRASNKKLYAELDQKRKELSKIGRDTAKATAAAAAERDHIQSERQEAKKVLQEVQTTLTTFGNLIANLIERIEQPVP